MQRAIVLAGGWLIVFVTTALILIRLMPGPLKDSDYLVVGSIATLAALLVVFMVLISTTMKARDVFFKKRKKKG
jgi:hypothetical protein